MPNKSKKQTKFPILAITLILILTIVALWKINISKKAPNEKLDTNTKSINLEGISINIPKTYIVTSDENNMYGKLTTSDTKDELGCTKVSNIQDILFEINSNNTEHPILEIQSWNSNKLSYSDIRTKLEAESRLDYLKNLSNLSKEDMDKLITNSFDKNMVVPLLNPWEGYLTCSGIYTLPIYIEKQNNTIDNRFDEIYYGEMLEGNGDTFNTPNRVIILKKADNWFILKEQQKTPNNFISKCTQAGLTLDNYNCVKNEWNSNRKSNEYKQWVNQILTWVK